MILGNFRSAVEHNSIARELDPFSTVFNFAYGLILYMFNQIDEAIIQFRKTLSIDNSFTPAYFWLSFSYLQKGLYSETIEEYKNVLSGDPATMKYIPVIDDIFRKSGSEGFLNWMIDEGIGLIREKYNQPYYLALCHALLNNKEMAFKWIGEACEQHVSRITAIKSDPGLKNLHEDPRFSIILGKMGLQ
jgi:tetratricopeptide (TPR) repeat protein